MTKINEFKPESAHTSLVFQTTLKKHYVNRRLIHLELITITSIGNSMKRYTCCNCVYMNFRKNRSKYNSFAAIGNAIWCFI